MLRELSFSDVSWSISVSMYICVSGIFCVTECNESSDINNNKHATVCTMTDITRRRCGVVVISAGISSSD